ncbi:RDD family protein [soil metagenome]
MSSLPPLMSPLQPARLSRRLFCIVYELCLLFAVTFVAGYLLLSLLQWRFPLPPLEHAVFQVYMLLVIGLYFTWFWHRSGQTLAMKTWRVRLVDIAGLRVGTSRAWLRYAVIWWGLIPAAVVDALGHPSAAAAILLGAFAINFAWAALDGDRQFLQDRLAGTRLMAT